MKKEIIINSSLHEVRIAMMEDSEVVELLVERADSKRIVGNVYKGRVTSVKPGLQAAFVDIGLERAGFLHASDLDHDEQNEDEGGRGRSRYRRVPDIDTVLKPGDDIIVQVTKEPINTKGPRLTADISLPGRYLVMMPKGRQIGVSRKIDDRRERTRLKEIVQNNRPDQGAFIIRTAATTAQDKAVINDVKYLGNLFSAIDTKNRESQAPALIHEDVGMVVGLIRDIFKEDTSRLIIDDTDDYNRLMAYVKTFAPDLGDRIQQFNGNLPIFDHFEIEPEIRKTLDKRVWMKKGGYLIIEQTEALVSIDVNTGRFTGHRNQEETILQTNLLAAKEVARQLRLRDMGGIIVTDFIDMESEGNRKRLFNEMRLHLKRDRARHKVFPVSGLGLVEMSRQRVRPSLESQLSHDCPYCTGMGKVLTMETMSSKIERLIHRIAIVTKETRLQIQANPVLALYMLEERPEQFRDLCTTFKVELNVLDDPTLHVEDFRVVSLDTNKDLIAEFEKKTQRGGRR